MNEETREIPFGEANSRLSEYYVLLFLILLSGFLLRIWGIWNIDGQDEYNEIFEALRVCSGHLNIERWAKRFYLYVLAFAYGVYYVIGWVFQVFHAPMDFATRIVRNMQPLFLIGRSISVIFGTASLFMTYLIGKSLFNRGVGLIAALFLCLNVINIKLSHYAMVDATLCFTVLVSFYFISRIHSDDGTHLKYYLLAGLFSGIALQNKVPAIILTIPFLLSHVFRSAGKKPLQYIFSKGLAYYCSSFLVGMILGNPAILLAPHKYLKSFLGLAKVFTVPINVTPSLDIGYIFYLKYFYRELGIVLSILAVYSFVRALVSGRREEILILSFIIPFFIVVGGSKFLVYARYMIPLMPFLYILCARYLVQLTDSLQLKQRLATGVLVIASIFLLIQPALNVAEYEREISGKSTRILAKEWIEANIRFGSKILMDSGKSINTNGPRIAENRESIIRILERSRRAVEKKDRVRTRGLVNRHALLYYELLLKTVPENSYNITYTMFGMEVGSIDYYISNQYQYFIISKGMKGRGKNEYFKQRYPKIAGFYNSLDTDNRIELIKTIGPTRSNTGPTFYVYKLPSAL